MAPNGPIEAARLQQSRPRHDDGAGTDNAWPNAHAEQSAPRCGFGAVGSRGCILPEGHLGLHVYEWAPGMADYSQSPADTETVNHPAHYNQHPAGIECIDVVEAFNFNLGNAIKYLWRAGLKPGTSTLEDLSKAAWYIRREIERIIEKGQRDERDQ